MGRDFSSLTAGAAHAFQVLPYLLAAGTGRVQILLRIAFDLRRAAAACCDFVSKLAESIHQFRLVDGRGELLRSKQALRLDGSGLAICPLGYIEEDGVRMELGRNIAIDRTRGVVLEFCNDEFAGSFWQMIAADARLRIALQFLERGSNGLAVRLAHTMVPAYQRCQRHGFGGGKGRIPPGPVFHRFDSLPVRVLVLIGGALPDKLFAGLRVLSLAEPREISLRDRTAQSEFCSQSALPLACNLAALRPVILFLRRELLLVVTLRLTGGKRLGDGQHGGLLHLNLQGTTCLSGCRNMSVSFLRFRF